MITLKSIVASIHDSGSAQGCLSYKVTVMVEINVKDFNKLCPKIGEARITLLGRRPARRDLGSLVLDVNNAVAKFNPSISSWNPSIDSNGDKRAKDGVKPLEFVYFMSKRDWQRAELLGFEHFKFKGQEPIPKYGQYINLMQNNTKVF